MTNWPRGTLFDMKQCALVLALILPLTAHAETLSGNPRVLDGDTLAFGKAKVRIVGIDAPETHQLCRSANIGWPCGIASKTALQQKIGTITVTCQGQHRDRYKRLLAHCYTGLTDLGLWMVQQGQAVAYTKYSTEYAPAQEQAKAAHIGLWASEFAMPWDWRKR